VRGNTSKFYEWLDSSSRCKLPDGPPVWICGDCHVGNLGPVADAKGRVLIQIRDLDQTVIGNPAHDLVRLGLSLASAARGSDLPGVTTARILEELIAGYEPVFQAFRKKCALTAIRPLNKAPHPILPQIALQSYRENQSYRCVFTQAGPTGDIASLA
jgi:uncharacterized protein (DUF2252 family)